MTAMAEKVIAIDPGPTQSAYMVYDGVKPIVFGKVDNAELLARLRNPAEMWGRVVVEKFQSFGMPVGKEVFETCEWIGRYREAWQNDDRWHSLYRKQVVVHLCGSARGKDANVRAALIDKFGGKELAIGRKATQGPLYGVAADMWSALAIAVTWWETALALESEAA